MNKSRMNKVKALSKREQRNHWTEEFIIEADFSKIKIKYNRA